MRARLTTIVALACVSALAAPALASASTYCAGTTPEGACDVSLGNVSQSGVDALACRRGWPVNSGREMRGLALRLVTLSRVGAEPAPSVGSANALGRVVAARSRISIPQGRPPAALDAVA
jgi:hypothetical protein